MFKELLHNITTPVAVWKNKLDKLDKYNMTCVFTNNKIHELQEDILLINYLEKTNITHYEYYKQLIDTGKDQYINLNNSTKILSKFKTVEDTYYEIIYNNNDDMNILYSISNKLRTPLTNIIGVSSLLDNNSMTEKDKKHINIIKDSCYDIVSVANDIIDIINLKSNKVQLNYEKITFKNLIDNIIKIIIIDIQSKNLKFNVKISDVLPDVISVDVQRLQQIIINLINNSLKNTAEGSITLDIDIFKKDEHPEFPFKYTNINNKYNILFKIKDTGYGINTKNKPFIDKILNIIHNYDSSIKTSYSSSRGNGLIICYYLCKLMNGYIWYKSEEDIGTVFYFIIECDGIKL